MLSLQLKYSVLFKVKTKLHMPYILIITEEAQKADELSRMQGTLTQFVLQL